MHLKCIFIIYRPEAFEIAYLPDPVTVILKPFRLDPRTSNNVIHINTIGVGDYNLTRPFFNSPFHLIIANLTDLQTTGRTTQETEGGGQIHQGHSRIDRQTDQVCHYSQSKKYTVVSLFYFIIILSRENINVHLSGSSRTTAGGRETNTVQLGWSQENARRTCR